MPRRVMEKLQAFFVNPYAAPLTEPLKSVARFALAPTEDFIECILEAKNDTYDDSPFIRRLFSRFSDSGHFGTFLAGTFGAAIGGLGAGIVGGFVAHAAGAGAILTGAAGIAAVGIGVVVAPFAIMAAVGFAAAAVGCVLGAPFGFLRGCRDAWKHHELVKTKGVVVSATPALQSAGDAAAEAAARIFQEVRALPVEVQGPVIRALGEKFGAAGGGERVLNMIETLPEKERETLVRGLKQKLAPEFEAVAEKDAHHAVTLQNEITVEAPIRFKHAGRRRASL